MSFKPETATEKLFRHLKDGSVWDVTDALKCGADPNGKSSEGSAIMLAARHAGVGSLKVLISAGAKLDDRDAIGDTLLMTALRHAQYKNIAYLLEQGIDIRAQNKYGETAADIAERTRNSTHESMEKNAMDGRPQAADRELFQTWESIAVILRDKHTKATTTELLGRINVPKPLRFKPRM